MTWQLFFLDHLLSSLNVKPRIHGVPNYHKSLENLTEQFWQSVERAGGTRSSKSHLWSHSKFKSSVFQNLCNSCIPRHNAWWVGGSKPSRRLLFLWFSERSWKNVCIDYVIAWPISYFLCLSHFILSVGWSVMSVALARAHAPKWHHPFHPHPNKTKQSKTEQNGRGGEQKYNLNKQDPKLCLVINLFYL